MAIYSAWRFVHPDLEKEQGRAGLVVSPSGGLALLEGDQSVRQAVLLLLSTLPGERVMRPDYGCDLKQVVFMPNDPTTHGIAIHYIRVALEKWEPRIEIVYLDANANPDEPSQMDIVLEYRVRRGFHRERLEWSLQLMGA